MDCNDWFLSLRGTLSAIHDWDKIREVSDGGKALEPRGGSALRIADKIMKQFYHREIFAIQCPGYILIQQRHVRDSTVQSRVEKFGL